jgi:hypothetical protein
MNDITLLNFLAHGGAIALTALFGAAFLGGFFWGYARCKRCMNEVFRQVNEAFKKKPDMTLEELCGELEGGWRDKRGE